MLLSFNKIKRNYNMNITGIIHIGGHYGEELQDYIDNGIQNIMVFEPLSHNFKILSEKAAELNANIEGYKVALGSEKGNASMYVSDNEQQSSSLLEPALHLSHHPHVKFPSNEHVEIDILDEYDCKDYNFINMDVQGYELEVLKGGREVLKQIKYVYCEVNRAEVYKNNAMVQDIDDFLGEYGMVRKQTDWAGDIWGDALYIKEK